MNKTDSITIRALRNIVAKKQLEREAEVERQAKKLVDRIYKALVRGKFEVENSKTLRVTVWTLSGDCDVKERAARLLEGYGFACVMVDYGSAFHTDPAFRQTFRLIMPDALKTSDGE